MQNTVRPASNVIIASLTNTMAQVCHHNKRASAWGHITQDWPGFISFIAYKVLLGDYDVPHSIPSVIVQQKVFFWQNLLCRHSSNWTNVTRRGLIRQQCAGSDQRDSGTKVEPMSRKSPTAQTNLALFKTSCEKRFKSWKILQINFVFYTIFAPLQFKARLDERADILICWSF